MGPVRAAFEDVVRAVESFAPLPNGRIDRELKRTLRDNYRKIAQLKVAEPSAVGLDSAVPQATLQHLLEVEFIAIYW